MWKQTVFRLLALSLAGGILCGAIWDVFKIPNALLRGLRCRYKNILQNTALFITDLLFCLVCGCVAVVVFYYGNEGNIRGIAVALMAAGFGAYRVSLGAFVCFLARKISRAVRKISIGFACKLKKVLQTKKRKVEEN